MSPACAGHPAEVTSTPERGAGTRGAGTKPPQQHPRGDWAGVPVSSPPMAVLLRGGEGLIKLLSFAAQQIRVLLEATLE